METLVRIVLTLHALTNQILSDIRSRTRVLHYLFVNVFPYKIFVRVKQKILTSFPREHKPFWQLSRLDDFNINGIPKGYSELSLISKIELFAKIIDS